MCSAIKYASRRIDIRIDYTSITRVFMHPKVAGEFLNPMTHDNK